MKSKIFSLVILSLVVLPQIRAAERRPAVLFATGWVHSDYVARPLHAMGIDVDACDASQMAERLAGGKYNVVVASVLNAAQRKAVDNFVARGGGAFVCNPENAALTPDWTGTNEWLARLGARPRWEVLQDGDASNVATDAMGCRLSFSDRIAKLFAEGVSGVLTLTWEGTTGCEPPMSFDFSPEWTVVARGAPSLKGVSEPRHEEAIATWIPKTPVAGSPALMGIRSIGEGRMAAEGIRVNWLFASPPNCPTAKAMLSEGADGRPSGWLRVFANAFRWLAEPSMAAGRGGAGTPDAILNPPVPIWEAPPSIDWTRPNPLNDSLQTKGLIGARTALSSGSGSVSDYVKAAKTAGLQYLVFLEDSLRMDSAKWDALVRECDAASDSSFAAIPGLTYEDAQGNHLYAFSDQVRFPQPSMLLPDHRLATTQSFRTRAYFDYVNELMQQKTITGFWNHRRNVLPVADYKLYNSFPIFTFEDARPIDSAFSDYLYLQGIGGCQAALAFEIMTSPDRVAKRAAEGWKVVSHRSPSDLRSKWFEGAWSFSGMGSQYVTNGPSILAWDESNGLCSPNGQWWRPDVWEFRVRLRAASEVGLKSVTIYDGDRGAFRRWLTHGAKRFEREIVLANCQQRGLTPVIEDVKGRKAIGMSYWNRNLNMEEFICSDRCNFLGNARLRAKSGIQTWTPVSFSANMGATASKGLLDLSAAPAVSLTLNSPTLPIDGAPAGFPTKTLRFAPRIPGELKSLFATPRYYLIGPEIAIGQADVGLGYDPAEEGAKTTPLGHPYERPQDGWGNSWGSWHHLVSARKAKGWMRIAACNWLVGGFRIGWHEAALTLKEPVTIGPKGIEIIESEGTLWRGGKKIASPESSPSSGDFARGTFATLEDKGGAIVMIAMSGPLAYEYDRGRFALYYRPGEERMEKGETLRYAIAFAGASGGVTTPQMLDFARRYGVADPGKPAYAPAMTRGAPIDRYLLWRSDAKGAAVTARIPRCEMPGFLLARVEGLNDNWSVILLDKARKGPNHRALPVRDGVAYAQIDTNDADSDLFIGHPVIADRRDAKLQVSWMRPGVWSIEAHNPTDQPMKVRLTSTPGWSLFAFSKSVVLPAGSGQVWTAKESAAPSSGVR